MQLAFSSGQPRATITGTVCDSTTGAGIPSAGIILVGTSYGASSDVDGRFVIQGIPTGSYSVQASVLGYNKTTVRSVNVEASSHVSLKIAVADSPVSLEKYGVVASPRPFPVSPEMPLSTYQLPKEEVRSLGRGLNDPLRSLSIMPGVAQTKVDRNDLLVRGA